MEDGERNRILVGNKPPGRPRRRRIDDTITDLRETEWVGVTEILCAVNTV
jgi:hypothetical protein